MAREVDKKLLIKFGKKLQELRKKKGLSLRELALESELGHPYIVKLEKGGSNPSLSIIIDLSKALGVDPGELIN